MFSFSDSPLIQELLAQRTHKTLLRILTVHFGTVSPEVAALLQPVQHEEKLDELIDWAVDCPDLGAFCARLSS
jgi:hypothetical protein